MTIGLYLQEMDSTSASPPGAETAIKAALAMVPALGGALSVIAGDVMERRRAGGLETAGGTLSIVGDADVLLSALRRNERLAYTFCDAVEAGMRTTLAGKRRAMGHAVGRAVLDDAKVDEAQLIVAALRDLDVPHLRELERFRRRIDDANSESIPPAKRSIQGGSSGMDPAIEGALVRHGCIFSEHAVTWGGGITSWGVSEFGRLLLLDIAVARPTDQP